MLGLRVTVHTFPRRRRASIGPRSYADLTAPTPRGDPVPQHRAFGRHATPLRSRLLFVLVVAAKAAQDERHGRERREERRDDEIRQRARRETVTAL